MSQLRRDELVRAAMDVLAEADAPVPAGDVVDQVATRLALTELETSLNPSGSRRFDTFIRFASGWLKAISWIDKSAAGWSITAEGLAAVEQYPDTAFLKEVMRRYRQIWKSRQEDSGWTDPRWPAVRDAIEAIPPGFWTAYKDLGEFAGVPARTVGTFISTNEIANAYRVLQVDGTVAPEFRWSDPARTDDPRELLEVEGIEFDGSGRASATQRITVEDLRELIGVSTPGVRAWLVRGSAVSGVNVVPQWLDEGFVSLAASHLRRVEEGVGYEELRSAVEADYAHLSYNQRKAKLAELNAFLNRMSIGNVVTTTSEGRVFVGRVEGDVSYADVDDVRTNIRRDVAWEVTGVDFGELPELLQTRLKSSATVVDLTEVADSVEALFAERAPADLPLPREVTLPDLSAEVVDGLLVGKEWLGEFVELLRSQRQVILHGPPGTGKTFLALEVANALTEAANVTLVQFHPAYSYEDFFEGYRPTPVDESGRVGFALTPGPFRKIVDQARENLAVPHVLIIDEINRANLAKVFGELYFVLEYRDRSIDLMYASGDEGRDFTLPKNVYIIGTMNTADRSIALVDTAMRRRFAFLSLHPDDDHMHNVLRTWLERHELPTVGADLLDALNARIPDRDFKVGPSYLMRSEAATDAGLERIWRTAILPLLAEMHYGDETVNVAKRYGVATLRSSLASQSGDDNSAP